MIQDKVDEALLALAESVNPRLLGNYKSSMGVWAYELNNSYRILYSVKDSENLIELYRVGDHKDAYGKD